MNLAAWLRAGRDRRKLTIEDVAKITKIQPRILEKLESGSFDGLPAEVFVKGFVRSFAKCVGLDESEALDKFSAAQAQPASISGPAGAVAKALVDTMSSSVRTIRASSPAIVVPPVDVAPVIEVEEPRSVDAQAARVIEVAPVVHAEAAPVVEVQAAPVIDPAAPVAFASKIDSAIVDAVAAVEAAAQNGKKKKSRKNGKQRARGKKKAQQELATEPTADAQAELVAEIAVPQATQEPIEQLASVPVDAHALDSQTLAAQALDVAVTGVFEKQSIETGPVAKIDAESIGVTSIEAKTNDALDVDVANGIPVEADKVASSPLAEGSGRISQSVVAVDVTELASETAASETTATDAAASETTAGSWQPTMPPITTAPSVPWRRPNLPAQTASAYVVPTLVIDDADPDSADREREDRIAKEPTRLSFLPPILLDREDRSARQGGLTLAVIILLIAATLTLSYLMRRPSPTGDGVTMLDGSSMLVG